MLTVAPVCTANRPCADATPAQGQPRAVSAPCIATRRRALLLAPAAWWAASAALAKDPQATRKACVSLSVPSWVHAICTRKRAYRLTPIAYQLCRAAEGL